MSKGLNSVRNPSSIQNEQHNDATGAQRSTNGELIAIEQVIPDSSAETPIPAQANLRVCNAQNAVAYIWAGKEGTAPGSIDATTGIALPPYHTAMFYVESSDDPQKSMAVKASSSSVQVVLMKK